ncbi:MAG: hypothetical protein IT349_19245 [Candidatus Eisenbacteria bacterium]|nr:hypothetical protein [Candidatus Eisenbacteria bacterium]
MPEAFNQYLMGGGYRVAPGDYSPGILRLFSALGTGGAQAKADQILRGAAQQDLYTSQAALNAEKIRASMDERERAARYDQPNAIQDIVTALSGGTPEQASASIRHFTGDPLRLPSDFQAVPVDAEDPAGNIGDVMAKNQAMQSANMMPEGLTPELKQKIGRIYGAFRGARAAGGKIDDIGQFIRQALQSDITDEAAGLARGGSPGTVSTQNRLTAAGGGKAYEPFASGTYGPYSQETGALSRPEVFESAAAENRAQAGAAGALSGERGARRKQIETETRNLETQGLKEPGRSSGVRGGRSSVYEQKKADWLLLYPNDQQGALDYASGQRRLTAADARKLAAQEAKAQNLQGEDFARYVRGATNEIMARNRGDDENVSRIRLENASADVMADAGRIRALKPDRKLKAIEDWVRKLQARGFDADEVKTILSNGGLGD